MKELLYSWEPEKAIPQGKAFFIRGIPSALTEEHNQAFYCWQQLRVRGANALRVDGHPDMGDGANIYSPLPQDYWRSLGIENFTIPAFHYGIINSMYWFNPHAAENGLRDLGSTTQPDRIRLPIRVRQWGLGRGDLEVRWDDESGDINTIRRGVPIDRPQMHIERPFLLDVDLDAFSCQNKRPLGVGGQDIIWSADHESGYEERIATTIELLGTLPKPDWITITRSQATLGLCPTRTFVPKGVVDKVQARFIESLEELYQTA